MKLRSLKVTLVAIRGSLVVWFSLIGMAGYGQVAGDSAAGNPRQGYVCFPATEGAGWECQAGKDQLPQRTFTPQPKPPSTAAQTSPVASPSAVPRSAVKDTVDSNEPATAKSPPAAKIDQPEESVLSWNQTPGTAPTKNAATLEGVPTDPSQWYTPTPPRAVEPSHDLRQDLAASIYNKSASSSLPAAGQCQGGYQVRQYAYPQNVASENYPIVAQADTLTSKLDENIQLVGNVTVEQGNRLIVAQSVDLDQQTRVAQFPLGVRMDQPGLVMQGQQATLHLNTKQVELTEAQFVLTDAQMRGEAGELRQNDVGDLTLSANSFTRCEPGNNGWELNTKSLLIEKGEVFGTAKGAVLRVKSVPVFYTPYLKFPISDERVSGFLFPNLSYSDEDGVDLSIPYYFNLSPNYDATVVPRYLSRRGAGGEAEVRHMSSWQNTIVGGAYLPKDDLYNGRLDRDDFEDLGGVPVLGPFDPADRWLAAVDHDGQIGPLRTLVDFTSVSDRDYFRDLGSDLSVSSRIELQRKAQVQYNNGGLFMRLWAQSFQRLDERTVDDYERLPEFEMLYNRAVGKLEFSLGAKWAEFDRDTSGLNGLRALTGTRTHLEPRVRLPLRWPFGFVTVAGGYRHTTYDLEQDPNAGGLQLLDDQPERNIGLGSVDGGLYFERDLHWFEQPLVQTLEPRLYYLWQEYDEQSALPVFDASRLTFGYTQLFRGNRFSGLDRIGDANQLSTGITTRFLSASTGAEYFRFSLGEIFYFEDRRVTLSGGVTAQEQQSSSAIASEMAARLAKHWRLTGTIVWDPHDNEVDEGGAGIQYRLDNRHIINLGFRHRREQDIEQSDFSLYWPVSDRISIMGRWNYDLVSGRTIEGFGGIEYSDCCLQVRLLARRFLDAPTFQSLQDVQADEGIFLQIVFKGLAGFGTKVESVLERGIRGYRSPQANSYFSNQRQ